MLNTGYYQIPIYCQSDFSKKPFFISDLKNMDKWPGSSALIRIRLAKTSVDGTKVLGITEIEPEKREEYGVWVKAPKYSTGAYNNSYCGVGETEIELIKTRVKRPARDCKTSAIELMNFYGKQIEVTEDTTEKDKEDQIIDFLDTFLILQAKTQLINLKFFSKYNASLSSKGFKFSVDGLHNLPSPGYYFSLYSINPPGDFYQEDSDSGGVRANSFFDWEVSTVNTIVYTEGYVKYGEVPFNPYAHFVVDVKSITMS